MLTHLTIKDFAIVADLSLELHAGMTVLTGATGAGKSILIDALQAVLGARADADMVRHGCDQADITASFSLPTLPIAAAWLRDQTLLSEADCILRRTINRAGRSKHFINGQLCTQLQVRHLGELLVNIHGQHENQRLLQRDQQLLLLDGVAATYFPQHLKLMKAVQLCFQHWQQVDNELKALRNQDDSHAQLALLKYQLEELANLALHDNEDEQLTAAHKQLANADVLAQSCHQALLLLQDDESNSIILLTAALKQVSHLQAVDKRLKNIFTLLSEALIQVQEAIAELRHYSTQIEVDPTRLTRVEQRLRVLYDVARKYKVAPAELPQLEKRLQSNLLALSQADQKAATLETILADSARQYQQAAKALSVSRHQAAIRVSRAVTQHICALGMPAGQFDLRFETQEKFAAQGLEKIELLVSANLGQPLKPLHKIASGGELSRISLAIQIITAPAGNTPSLIFDEVDVGIGGETAEMVGALLRQLSQKAQVICITHLPQVAIQGHHHLQVSKAVEAGQTTSSIRELSAAERIVEVARVLGGIKITAQTLAHAQEMLG